MGVDAVAVGVGVEEEVAVGGMAPRRFPHPDVRAEPRAVEVDGSELTRRTAASPREEEDARANRARGAIGDAAADDTDMRASR